MESKGLAKKSGRKGATQIEKRARVLPMEKVEKPVDKPLAKDNEAMPLSLGQARENVARSVREAAGEIAEGLIIEAKAGGLATAKYLFEMTGLYPAAKEAGAGGSSLAEMLLKRLGIPNEERGGETNGKSSKLASDVEVERIE